MNIEKTYFDYSRLQDWQKGLFQQFSESIPENVHILEISSDYPRFSGYFKKNSKDNWRIIQIVRGRVFIEKGDNLNFDKNIQHEYSVIMPRNLMDDPILGLFILDCSIFISDLVNEYNIWNAYFRKGTRILLPLQEYGIYDYEMLMSLPAFVMKGALLKIGLQAPQVMGNLFTGLIGVGGKNVGLTELKDSAIDLYNRIVLMRDTYADLLITTTIRNRSIEYKQQAMIDRMWKNANKIGIDMLCFSYFIEYYFLKFHAPFSDLCEKILSIKYPETRDQYVIDFKTLMKMQNDFASVAKICDLDGIISKINQCDNLEQLNTLLMKEQLRLIVLQDITNPLFYIMLGNVEF